MFEGTVEWIRQADYDNTAEAMFQSGRYIYRYS